MDLREHDLYNLGASGNTHELEKRVEVLEKELKELRKEFQNFVKMSRTKIK